MRSDRRGALLALWLALVWSVPALAQAPAEVTEPIRVLEAVLAEQGNGAPAPGAVRAAVERAFDTEAIARAVLGDQAEIATPGQLERFRAVLTGRIDAELLKRREARRDASLVIAGARPIAADEWLVTSHVRAAAEPQRTIMWRIRAAPAGAAIHDVLGDGTSMVRGLRNEYAAALRRLGLEGLIVEMEARNR
jgi:phospholipid transport system substrate-binding protein